MSRVVSISLTMVYMVMAIPFTTAFASGEAERSDGPANSGRVVRDHRLRSNTQAGTTVTNTPIVRDHRTAPIVRDHRDTPVVRDHRSVPIVRDHRTTPTVRDHRKPTKAIDPLAKQRRPGTIPPVVRPIDPGRGDGQVIVRDHRDGSSKSGGTKVTNTPIIRDHRNPVIRDHRQPVVRDHRTAKTDKPPTVIDPGRGTGKVIVRDHRSAVVRNRPDSSAAPGGVKVTNTPVIRDHRGSSSRVFDVFRD